MGLRRGQLSEGLRPPGLLGGQPSAGAQCLGLLQVSLGLAKGLGRALGSASAARFFQRREGRAQVHRAGGLERRTAGAGAGGEGDGQEQERVAPPSVQTHG